MEANESQQFGEKHAPDCSRKRRPVRIGIRYGRQRWKCPLCKRSWIEEREGAVGGPQRRWEKEKIVDALKLWLDGYKIPTIAQRIGVSKGTVREWPDKYLKPAANEIRLEDPENKES